MTKVFLSIFIIVIYYVASLTYSLPAFACASCGSGGDDPMILYPNENYKAYVGMTKSGDLRSYDFEDEEIKAYSLTSRSITTVAVGKTFSPRLFTTVTAPYIVNRRDRYELSGWGDPLFALRYTAVAQTLADERIPQLQLLAGYRPALATSIYDSKDSARLDVRGTGVPEVRAGMDIWYGMLAWKAGLAQTVTVPTGERETDFGRKRPGTTYRTTLTTGYGWGASTKVLAGVNREFVTRFSVDNQPQERSEILNHSAFVSGDTMVARDSSIRMTYAKSGFAVKNYLSNYNAVRSQSVSISAMKSF